MELPDAVLFTLVCYVVDPLMKSCIIKTFGLELPSLVKIARAVFYCVRRCVERVRIHRVPAGLLEEG